MRPIGWLFVGVAAVISGLVAALPVEAAPCWFPPVVGTVTDPYREPPCPWCAGNRGLDYRVDDDALVRAAASGRVEFAGAVANIGYVVVRLPNGWRHTYGRLVSSPKRQGEVVLAGAPVGRASGSFFFGLRIADAYADPATFIGELRRRPRLVPIDGTLERPSPPAKPTCPPRTPTRPPTHASDEREDDIGTVRSSHGGSNLWR